MWSDPGLTPAVAFASRLRHVLHHVASRRHGGDGMSIDRHRRHLSIATMATDGLDRRGGGVRVPRAGQRKPADCCRAGSERERARQPAERRHERSDRVLGRRTDRHRLGCRNSEAPAGHRRISGRHRSRPRRKIRLSQRTEPATRLALVQEQPGGVQRRPLRPVQDHPGSRSRSRESDAQNDRADLEARGGRAVNGRHGGNRVDARSHRHRSRPV